MPLSKTQWERASGQGPSPADLYGVLSEHAPKALTLDEIRGRGDPYPRKSTLTDALQRVRIRTLLDTMIYRGDIEKKVVDGEAYYRPLVWTDGNPDALGFELSEGEEG